MKSLRGLVKVGTHFTSCVCGCVFSGAICVSCLNSYLDGDRVYEFKRIDNNGNFKEKSFNKRRRRKT